MEGKREVEDHLRPSKHVPSTPTADGVDRADGYAVSIAGVVRLVGVLHAMHRPAHDEARAEGAL